MIPIVIICLSDDSPGTEHVAREISKAAPVRVIRQGSSQWPLTSQAVADLERQLAGDRADQRYILVGASFRGFTAMLFAHRHPEKTQGVVLVESSHPDQVQVLNAALPRPGAIGYSPAVDAFRMFITGFPDVWPESCRELSAVTTLGRIPLRVLAAGQHTFPPGLDPEIGRELSRLGLALQEQFAAKSTRGNLRVLPEVGHGMTDAAPEVIIEEIKFLLDLAAAE